MKEVEWSDKFYAMGRDPWLLFIKNDEVFPFAGEDIPGVAVIRSYEKGGEWSLFTYHLQMADTVRYIEGWNGFGTNTFEEGIGYAVGRRAPDTWAEMAEALGISVPSAMEFLRDWRPKTAENLDFAEQALNNLEESSSHPNETVKITVSFGCPLTNREVLEGYWESPKRIPGYAAEIRLKDPEKWWIKENIEVVGISGTVLSVKFRSGMHCGYDDVRVAVIPGTERKIPAFELS